MPVKRTLKDGEFVKQGDQWVMTKQGERGVRKKKR
jgi:hypothetical protein